MYPCIGDGDLGSDAKKAFAHGTLQRGICNGAQSVPAIGDLELRGVSRDTMLIWACRKPGHLGHT